jgi:RNA polymerase sigma factor (sigma-70 family)
MKTNYRATDAELLNQYRQGDERAFATLLNRHKSRIYTTAYLILRDKYQAEDVMQESFMKVVDNIKADRYVEEGKFVQWLVRVAHNLSIDKIRKRNKMPIAVTEDGVDIFNQLQFAQKDDDVFGGKAELLKYIREYVAELPEEQRQVLLMRHFAGMSFKEIADFTDVSINTALGRMRYALINIRKKLSKHQLAYDRNMYQT